MRFEVIGMGMDCLRKIGKYALAPAAFYVGLSLAEPAYTDNMSAAQAGERQVHYAKGLEDHSSEEEMEIERLERRFALETNQAALSWRVISPYAEGYKRIAREFGMDPYMTLGQAAVANSSLKALMKRA